MNELRMGARQKPPAKPALLATYETVNRFGMQVLAGGLIDQPYIWLLQYEVIDQEVKLQEALRAAAEAVTSKPGA